LGQGNSGGFPTENITENVTENVTVNNYYPSGDSSENRLASNSDFEDTSFNDNDITDDSSYDDSSSA